jgi:predicted nucleic acid-binding protein
MPFVVDASVSLAWFFDEEEHNLIASNVLARMLKEEALVPPLWWFEVRNALLVSERAGRSSEERTAATLLQLAALPVNVDREPDEATIYGLSRRHNLTFYDAAYLELAQRNAVGIATFDRALVRAARAEQVPLIGE